MIQYAPGGIMIVWPVTNIMHVPFPPEQQNIVYNNADLRNFVVE